MAVDPSRLTPVPLFAGLSADQLAALAAKFEEREGFVGEHLSSEGGAGYFFFVIESGKAEVAKHGETVAELGPGDFFGEGAIFRARRRTATVTATEPIVLLAMFGADFAKLVSDIPDLHTRIESIRARSLPTVYPSPPLVLETGMARGSTAAVARRGRHHTTKERRRSKSQCSSHTMDGGWRGGSTTPPSRLDQ